MKITLYMAVSADGFIAKKNGDSDWVSEVDAEIFEQEMAEKGCIVVGRKTFDQYQGEIYPVDGVTNIVLTTDPSQKSDKDNVVYASSPTEAIKIAEEKGQSQILLIGGGITNGLFLKEGLIDEVILSVHPLILGDGIKLFEGIEQDVNMELVSSEELDEGLIQLRYRVKK